MAIEKGILPRDINGVQQLNPKMVHIYPDDMEAVYTAQEGFGYTSGNLDPRITHLFFTSEVSKGHMTYTHLFKDPENNWEFEQIGTDGQRQQGEVFQYANFSMFVGNEPIIPQMSDERKITGVVTEVTAVAGDYLLQFLGPRSDTTTPEGPIPPSIRRFAVIRGGRE